MMFSKHCEYSRRGHNSNILPGLEEHTTLQSLSCSRRAHNSLTIVMFRKSTQLFNHCHIQEEHTTIQPLSYLGRAHNSQFKFFLQQRRVHNFNCRGKSGKTLKYFMFLINTQLGCIGQSANKHSNFESSSFMTITRN